MRIPVSPVCIALMSTAEQQWIGYTLLFPSGNEATRSRIEERT